MEKSKTNSKNKVVTILVVTATLLLAGIAVFTAIRLYDLRNQPVAPNVPSSEPAAQEIDDTTPDPCLISFSISLSTSTATATPTATSTATASPTATATTTGSPSQTPTATSTATSTATETPTSNPTSTATSKTSVQTTTSPQLPNAGMSWPTMIGGALGIVVLFGSLLLIF